MDPIANQTGVTGLARPALALQGDLGAVLQEGRVLAGEVLQRLDGGTLLVGIGRHRVPAEAEVELAPGQRFVARVEVGQAGTVLRLLGGAGAAEPALATALRGVLGQDRPVGELLHDLAAALRASIAGGGARAGEHQELAARLEAHLFRPDLSGEELRTLLDRSGLHLEASLLALALRGKDTRGAGEILQELASRLAGELAEAAAGVPGPPSAASIAALAEELHEALQRLVEELGARGLPTATGELRRRLELALRPILARLPQGAFRDRALAALPRLLERLAADGGPALREALRALASGDLEALAGDLKAQLLGALAGEPDGDVLQTLRRALAGLESEQLLNLARREFQEGWHLSLPIPDHGRFATAHLFHRPHEEAAPGEEEGMQRLTLAVDFSRLGPLRADLGLRDDLLALRLSVAREDSAARLRGLVDELRERLAIGGREVRVSVVVAAEEDAAADPLSQDVRWLRENHLMDLSG